MCITCALHVQHIRYYRDFVVNNFKGLTKVDEASEAIFQLTILRIIPFLNFLHIIC